MLYYTLDCLSFWTLSNIPYLNKENISEIETAPIVTSKCGRYILRSVQLKKLFSISD
jgi:hypothetical protein